MISDGNFGAEATAVEVVLQGKQRVSTLNLNFWYRKEHGQSYLSNESSSNYKDELPELLSMSFLFVILSRQENVLDILFQLLTRVG